MATDCLIGLGSNLGRREDLLRQATDSLAALAAGGFAASEWCESLPAGGTEASAAFLNGVVRLNYVGSAEQLLRDLENIENRLGRVRIERWSPRTIDLDLLLFGRDVITTSDLVVPHPRMAFRRFVLAPADRIAADMLHPPSGLTVGELWRRLNDVSRYVAIAGPQHAAKAAFAQELGSAARANVVSLPRDFDSHPTSSFAAALDLLRKALAPAASGWAISDFFAPEIAAVADWPDASSPHLPEWPEPRLVILLARGEGRLDVPAPDASLQLQSHAGPVLSLSIDDPRGALEEAAAAIAAMDESSLLGWIPSSAESSPAVEAGGRGG